MAAKRLTSKLVFLDVLPTGAAPSGGVHLDPSRSLVIYDQILEKVSPKTRIWLKQFPHRYAVNSGEGLKALEAFPEHFRRLSKIAMPLSPKSMSVIAVGGGSVGDFAGFFASVYKRGVDLVHVPSTWLAAIDSSHGGKTALNNGSTKNQLGTFYPASQVLLIREILMSQPDDRIEDALGELGKIAIIDGSAWVKSMARTRLKGGDLLWKFLKPAIQAKLKVVARDPQEKSGIRQVLNLGHTIGHVLEATTGISHGKAVAQGLFFALNFSQKRGDISSKEVRRVRELLEQRLGLIEVAPRKPLQESRVRELLLQDKKKSGGEEVIFILVKRMGRVERTPISVANLLVEAKRQKWVRER